MKLREFIKKYYPSIKIRYDHEILGIYDYDYKVEENGIFICSKLTMDSTIYINKAIENKARTIVYDNEVKFKKQKGINYLLVDSVKVFMGRLFKEIIEQLDKKPIMIGVTGTSGKTTCTRLLYNYLKKECYDVLLIGTHKIYSYYGLIEEMVKTKNTTINLAYLYELLRNKKFDYDYVVMEVSSEGIMEGRILGIDFEVVSVTNVSSDHLNYHKSIEAYVLAKEKLLYNTNKNIILNIDDESYSKYKDVTINKVVTYGVNRGKIKAYNLNLTNTSTSFKVKDQNKYYLIETNLVGRFNVYNILNVWSIIRLLDLRIEPFIKMLKNCEVPLGRMNFKKVGKSLFIVDYAHTINEVNSVFDYLKDLKNNKKVVTVIGCGGNRDATKRSIIGKTVTENSDYVIFTEDNSRNESFGEIINDLTCDIKIKNYEVIENRGEAIKYAYDITKNEESIILVLGKGEEDVIIKKGIEIPFSDLSFIDSLYE